MTLILRNYALLRPAFLVRQDPIHHGGIGMAEPDGWLKFRQTVADRVDSWQAEEVDKRQLVVQDQTGLAIDRLASVRIRGGHTGQTLFFQPFVVITQPDAPGPATGIGPDGKMWVQRITATAKKSQVIESFVMGISHRAVLARFDFQGKTYLGVGILQVERPHIYVLRWRIAPIDEHTVKVPAHSFEQRFSFFWIVFIDGDIGADLRLHKDSGRDRYAKPLILEFVEDGRDQSRRREPGARACPASTPCAG